MRSLACELPHEASREFLINYFEEIRLKYIELKNADKVGSKGHRMNQDKREDKHFYKFILNFFRIQGILYTKIGVDELDQLFENQSVLLRDYLNTIEKETNKMGESMKM